MTRPSDTLDFLRQVIAALARAELGCEDYQECEKLSALRREANRRAEWIEKALEIEA